MYTGGMGACRPCEGPWGWFCAPLRVFGALLLFFSFDVERTLMRPISRAFDVYMGDPRPCDAGCEGSGSWFCAPGVFGALVLDRFVLPCSAVAQCFAVSLRWMQPSDLRRPAAQTTDVAV